MKKLLKNIIFGVWMYWVLTHLIPFHGKIKKYKKTGQGEKERAEILKATTRWGTDVIHKLGVELRIKGLENIPKDGPVVFVSNHQGNGDIPIFAAAVTTKQFGFLAKSGLKKLPCYGKWIADLRSVFIERDDPRESLKAVERGIELINQGFSIGVFAEGKRSQGPEMAPFKKGSLRIATKTGVPVVPITLNGTWHMFEEFGCASPAKVDFVIHPVIETKNMSRAEASNLAETVEQIIRKELEALQAKKNNQKDTH